MNTPELLKIHTCQRETFKEFKSRYHRFGKELFVELKGRGKKQDFELNFYQGTSQPEDAYAIYNTHSTTIALQLDPLIERIILWDEQTSFEIGDWYENPVKVALYALDHWEEMKATGWKNMPF